MQFSTKEQNEMHTLALYTYYFAYQFTYIYMYTHTLFKKIAVIYMA